MSHAISVPTPFNDIAELGESFASRVDEERLMLPHTDPVPEGEWVQFAVTLADGSAALSGVGRCTQSFDNGEDRAPEYRYDVVMDSLQFDEMAQVYFERLLQVRAAQFGDEPQTGEMEIPPEAQLAEAEEAPAEAYAGLAAEEPPDESQEEAAAAVDELIAEPDEAYADPGEVAYEPPAEEAFAGEEEAYASPEDVAPMATVVAHAEEAFAEEPPTEEPTDYPAQEAYGEPESLESVELADVEAADVEPAYVEAAGAEPAYAEPVEPPQLQAPAESAIYDIPPPTPPGQLPSPHANPAVLTRRLVEATWSPEPMLRPEPSPSTGYFDYPEGPLPQPAEPPRPDMDPSLRVSPAPQPGEEGPIQTPATASSPVHEEPAEYEGEAEGYEEPEYEDAGDYAAAAEDVEGDYDIEGGQEVDASEVVEEGEATAEGYDEGAFVMDDEAGVYPVAQDAEPYDAYDGPETVQADVGEFEDEPVMNEETAVSVELPEEAQ